MWKKAKATSSIIAAMLIMSLITSGIVLISHQAAKQADKIDALSSSQRARNLSELLESSIKIDKTGDVLWIKIEKKPMGILQITKKPNNETTIRLYSINEFPKIIEYNGTHIGIGPDVDFNNTELILVLEGEGKLSLGEILDRKMKTTNKISRPNGSFGTSELRKVLLDDFIKSLLSPSDIYDLFLNRNISNVNTFEQIITIPLKIEVYGYGLERGVKRTTHGCTDGKAKNIYAWARLSARMLVSHNGEMLYDHVYNISLRNYSWYRPVDRAVYTPYIPFNGKIVLKDNTTLVYEGKIQLKYYVRLTAATPAYCSNSYSPGKVITGLYIDISLVFRKERSQDLLIIVFDKNKYRLIELRGDLLDTVSLSQYAISDSFAIVVSDVGNTIAFNTGHDVLRYWPYNRLAKIYQDGIRLEAIIYRAW